MKKVLPVLAVLAASCFGSIVFAADGDAPVVKGNIEVYGAAKLSVDVITTDVKTTGVDHSFSKRTVAYVLYAMTRNDDDATYGLGQSGAGGAYTPKAGESPSVISFGINHNF